MKYVKMKKAFLFFLIISALCILASCKTAESAAEVVEEEKPKSNLEALMAMNVGTRQAGDNSIRTTNWFESQAKKKAEENPAEENQGKVIFYGASNIDYWKTVSEDFPEYNILNFAIAGTTIGEQFSYSQYVIYPYNPKVLVLSGSTNDYVAAGNDVADDVRLENAYNARVSMFEDYSERFPESVFVILGTLCVPARDNFTAISNKLNEMIKEYCDSHDRFFFVEDGDFVYNADGSFDMDLFEEDGIHFTSVARSQWAEYIRPVLAEAVDSLSDKGNVLK